MAKKQRKKIFREIKKDVITESYRTRKGSENFGEGKGRDAGARTLDDVLREGYPDGTQLLHD